LRKFFSRWSKNILYNCFSNAERKATFIPHSAFRIPHWKKVPNYELEKSSAFRIV